MSDLEVLKNVSEIIIHFLTPVMNHDCTEFSSGGCDTCKMKYGDKNCMIVDLFEISLRIRDMND